MSSERIAGAAGLAVPVPLTAHHDVTGFDCGEPALDKWLKRRALANETHFARTCVVCEDAIVVAFVSIAAGAVERVDAPGKLRRNAPDTIPVSVIGRLAVARGYAGRGLGADLLSDALRRIAVASRTIGISAVLVQAKSESAQRFYLACAEFIKYPTDSRTLFLPIETVVDTFGND